MNKKCTLALLLLFLVNVVHAQKASSFSLGVNQTAYKLLDTDGFSNISASPNISLGYNLGKFSLNTEVGQMNFKASRFFPEQKSLVDRLGTLSGTDKWKGSYFLAGPGYNFVSTQNFSFGIKVLTGLYKPSSAANYEITDDILPNLTYENYQGFLGEKKSFLTVKGGLDLEYYPKSKPFGFRLSAGYTSLNTEENLQIARYGKDFSKYSLTADQTDDVIRETLLRIPTIDGIRYPNFNNIYATLGIIYKIGGKDKSLKNKKPKTKTPITSQGLEINKKPVTKISKEKPEKRENLGKLVSGWEEKSKSFKHDEKVPPLTWQWLKKTPVQSNYLLTIKRRTETGAVTIFNKEVEGNSFDANEVFEKYKNELGNETFIWSVKDLVTGQNTEYRSVIMSPCNINSYLTDFEIACNGYVGINREFNVCFNSNFQSSTGNLSFAQFFAGLKVTDPSSGLPLAISGLTPSLTPQTGNGSLTVQNYCFDVTVPPSTNTLDILLQGDDLNGSGFCIPAPSAIIDSLPSCLCNDCDELEILFNNISVGTDPSTGQLNANIDLNVSEDIYGVELQVVSTEYIASPSTCTAGVDALDKSGVFLTPTSTINGQNFNLYNETASGSSNSNNSMSKTMKYTSITPMNGTIPLNLTLGLPQPRAGMDADCCQIEYKVCLKVTVFLQDGSCSSCSLTECFKFQN
jgi:hypothetical protein